MLLKADEAAKLLAVRPARLYEMARSGVIPSVKIGEKSVRFSESAIKEWIERGGVADADMRDAKGQSEPQAA